MALLPVRLSGRGKDDGHAGDHGQGNDDGDALWIEGRDERRGK